MFSFEERNIRKIMSREDLLFVLFHDDKQRPLSAQLKVRPKTKLYTPFLESSLQVSLVDLESTYGMAFVTISDVAVAKKEFRISKFPAVVLVESHYRVHRSVSGPFISIHQCFPLLLFVSRKESFSNFNLQ